jgi:hypothetical protein
VLGLLAGQALLVIVEHPDRQTQGFQLDQGSGGVVVGWAVELPGFELAQKIILQALQPGRRAWVGRRRRRQQLHLAAFEHRGLPA